MSKIAIINRNMQVTGFGNKETIHDLEKPLLHATTLILVVKAPAEETAEPQILIGNKASKVLKLPNGVSAPTGVEYWDTPGGHLEYQDFFPAFHKSSSRDSERDWEEAVRERKPVLATKSRFYGTAKRELLEEIQVTCNYKNFPKIFYLFTSEYGPAPTKGLGMNWEISPVFCCLLPSTIDAADVIMRDDWAGGFAELSRTAFETRFMTFTELLEKYKKNPSHFMDGIARILEKFTKEQRTSDWFIQYLRERKKAHDDYEKDWYYDMITRDAADPDDGTLRNYEQIQEDWNRLGFHNYNNDMLK